MKATYKTILMGESARQDPIFHDSPDKLYEYKLIELGEPCCEKMKTALADDAIGFGEIHDTILNKDCNINFADCSPYPEGAVWDYYKISFCPFCGQPVETEEIERVSQKKVQKTIRYKTTDYEEVPVEK